LSLGFVSIPLHFSRFTSLAGRPRAGPPEKDRKKKYPVNERWIYNGERHQPTGHSTVRAPSRSFSGRRRRGAQRPPGHRPPPRSSAPMRVSPGRPPAGAQRVDRRARRPGSIRNAPSPPFEGVTRPPALPATEDPAAHVGQVTRPLDPYGAVAGPHWPRFHAPPDPKLDAPSSGLSQIKAASGLRSVARNNKATRLRTRPGRSTKSSAKDLSLRTVKLQSASRGAPFRGTPHRQPAVVRGRSLFVSDCGVQGRITPFRHGF
jgi:hypothetical protein